MKSKPRDKTYRVIFEDGSYQTIGMVADKKEATFLAQTVYRPKRIHLDADSESPIPAPVKKVKRVYPKK